MIRRKFKKARIIDRKIIDLSVAWLKGTMTYTQFCKEVNRDVHSNSYIYLARALKVAYRSKLI